MIERRGAPRLRIKRDPDERQWYAAVINDKGQELERSPAGTEAEAEQYMNTYRRCGAWRRS